ncbi:hypothetical protein [Embleya sp. NPDC005971]|uniref:hypothetical protein n=1 Tax=Embleya sp. NPDC005971 TaxID=3156724 RepID=UPI0033DE81D5
MAALGLPVLGACGEAFADERITVTVETGPAGPVGPRTEVDTGRVHVVHHPGVLTSVRIGDHVAVTVRPGCGCSPGAPPTPPAARPPRPRPPAPTPPVTKTTEPAAVAPPAPRPPRAAAARPYTFAVLDALPAPPRAPASAAERPPAPRPLRIAGAPPEDDAAHPGFADGIGPALIVSILPAALAALLPHPARRGVRP